MKKILLFAFIGILAALSVFFVAKNFIVKIVVEKLVETTTGLPLTIKHLDINIPATTVGINDLVLMNPRGYEDRIMIDIPEIYVDYDLRAIIKGKIHLKEARIYLKEFVVVKNRKGDLNLDAFKSVKKTRTEEPKKTKKKRKAPKLQIDSLELRVDKVVYKDYSGGGVPKVKEFNVNINQKFHNIDNSDKFVNLIIAKALAKTTIARLADFDLNALQGSLEGVVTKSAQKVVDEVGQVLNGTGQKAKSAVGTAASAVQKTTQGLTERFRFLRGGEK
jgi:hypothetical protein